MHSLTDLNQKMITLFGKNLTVVRSEIQKKCFNVSQAGLLRLVLHCWSLWVTSCRAAAFYGVKTSNLSKDVRLKRLNQSSQLESVHGLAVIPTSWWHTPEDGNTLWTHRLRRDAQLNVIFFPSLWGWFNFLRYIWQQPQKWSNMARSQGSSGSSNISSYYLVGPASTAELNAHAVTATCGRSVETGLS